MSEYNQFNDSNRYGNSEVQNSSENMNNRDVNNRNGETVESNYDAHYNQNNSNGHQKKNHKKHGSHYESKLEMWFLSIMSVLFSVLCASLWIGILLKHTTLIMVGGGATLIVFLTIVIVALIQKDKCKHQYNNHNHHKFHHNNHNSGNHYNNNNNRGNNYNHNKRY